MEMNSKNLVSGVVRAQKVVPVEVGIDTTVIDQAAEVATTVIMQKFGDALGLTREEVLSFHVCSLKAALKKAIDGDAKVNKGIWIPCYFDSMIKGLSVKMGRSVINPSLAQTNDDVPASYSKAVLCLKALGVAMVRPHSPAADSSATLSLFRETIDDVDYIVGNSKDIAVDDLVRRGFLKLADEQEAILKGIAGELAMQYGELDTLLIDYFSSAVRVAI